MTQKVWGAVCAVAVSGALSAQAAPPETAKSAERGKYLVNAMGCNDCHTPKVMTPQGPAPDGKRLLSGHPEDAKVTAGAPANAGWMASTNEHLTAWSGPWGVSFAMNLTPDENTGIGSWSEETFVKALRTGRHMGVARPILPPMPYWNLAALNDADLRAVYAYLRSIPPVKNRVPEPIPPSGPPAGK